MEKSDIVFTATDSNLNLVAQLDQDGLKHVHQDHPEIRNKSTIKKAIENPDYICVDKDYETTYTYYRKHKMVSLCAKGEYLKVPVDYRAGADSGRVKTAFIDNLHPTDEIIWTRSAAK